MLPTAHIAAALLANRALGLDGSVRTAAAGALLPDLIDKTLSWVLGLAPSGRHIGHAALTAAVLSMAAGATVGRRRGASFGMAYVTHLVCDLWHGGHVPWLMPFKRYDLRAPRWAADLSPETLLLEAAGAVVVVLLVRRAPEPIDAFDMGVDA